LLAGLLAFIFIPFLPRREYVERYSIYILFRFAITYFFSLVIVGGVSLMLLMINALFEVNIPDTIYFDIALVVAGVFAPAFFLAYVPDARQAGHLADQMEESYIYPKVLEIFLAYILAPILLAYAVILYVYMFFITATLSWPKGMVSNLILWYSLISAGSLFLTYPLRERNRWIGLFVTFFPWLQIPLIGLMLVAVGIRINQYGITENRYYVIAAAIWLLVTFIAYGWRRWQVSPVRLMALLAAMMLLSVLGPWSSAAVSIANQNDRLEQILSRYELIEEGKLRQPANVAELNISATDQRDLSGILNYFRDVHQDNDVRVLREVDSIEKAYEWLGITNDGYSGDYFYYQLNNGNGVNVIPISGYDWLIDFSFYYPAEGESLVKELGDYQLQYLPQEKVLILTERASMQEIYRENVSELAQQVVQKIRAESATASGITPTVEQLTYEANTDQVSVRYLFTTITGTNNQELSTASTLDQIQFALYLKIN
jgi:hypothetical protein